MNVAIYVSVSTQIQVENEGSLTKKRDFLTDYAKSQDWNIVEFYIDKGYSSKGLERPALDRLREDAKQQKFDLILIYKLDQLTRSSERLSILLKEFSSDGIKVKSATENVESLAPMEDFVKIMALAMSEPEADDMRKRMLSNMTNMKHISNQKKFPYGYDQDGEIIPSEKEIIQRIAKLHMDGSDYESIANRLNEEGRLYRERSWSSMLVSQTLKNPFYTGIVEMVSRTNPNQHLYVKGDHEAILTEEELSSIQEL